MKKFTGFDGNNPMDAKEFLQECTFLKKHLGTHEDEGHISTKPEIPDCDETLTVDES